MLAIKAAETTLRIDRANSLVFDLLVQVGALEIDFRMESHGHNNVYIGG